MLKSFVSVCKADFMRLHLTLTPRRLNSLYTTKHIYTFKFILSSSSTIEVYVQKTHLTSVSVGAQPAAASPYLHIYKVVVRSASLSHNQLPNAEPRLAMIELLAFSVP